jgi:endonuclease III
VTERQKQLVEALIQEGRQRLHSPKKISSFGTGIPQAETFLNDIIRYPHHFVLGCVMDRQIKAEKAWIIPYRVGEIIGGFTLNDYLSKPLHFYTNLFVEKRLHRFNKTMGVCFFEALQRIHQLYNDNASNIWINNPSAKEVIQRFDEFMGVGDKIANMAVNILVIYYKVKMSNYSAIDLPPDSQVKKFFVEHGFLDKEATPKDIILLARKLYPEYPGLLDIAWKEGRKLKLKKK